jgi:pyrroline-5-carboxylate reductase
LMNIGFIGTGVITEAIINGIIKSRYSTSNIYISLRSETVSTRLAKRSSKITVLDNNQDIVDRSDLVILALLPEQAEEVLAQLNFANDPDIISLIATLQIEQIRKWTSQTSTICRAVPLPSVADHNGITTVFPPNERAEKLFGHLGQVVSLETLDAFDAFVTAGATMGLYFDTLETATQWLCVQGTQYQDARRFLAALFYGLAETTNNAPNLTFAELRSGHSTPNGLNQQVFEDFRAASGQEALVTALNSLQERIMKGR